MKLARTSVVVFNQPWRRIAVEMIDNLLVADMDLILFDQCRNRNNYCKLFWIALEVVDHVDHGLIVLPGQNDLRRLVEDLRVGFRYVEAAKAPGQIRLSAQEKQCGQEQDCLFHGFLLSNVWMKSGWAIRTFFLAGDGRWTEASFNRQPRTKGAPLCGTPPNSHTQPHTA